MRKLIFLIFFLIPTFLSYAQDIASLKEELEKLKKEYEQVVRDRDNILSQVKNLLQYKVKAREMSDEVARVNNLNEKLKQEKQVFLSQIAELKEHISQLQKDKGQLKEEIELSLIHI